jgi:cell division protein FtsB
MPMKNSSSVSQSPKRTENPFKVLTVILGVLFLVTAGILALQMINGQQVNSATDELKDQYNQIKAENTQLQGQLAALTQEKAKVDDELNELKIAVSMADWQVYTNSKYNYQVKYPANWAMSGQSNKDEVYLLPQGVDENNEGSAGQRIAISFFSDEARLANITGRTAVTINGLEAEQGIDNGIGKFMAFLFKKDNGYVEVSWLEGLTDQAYNQILSTFKFVE